MVETDPDADALHLARSWTVPSPPISHRSFVPSVASAGSERRSINPSSWALAVSGSPASGPLTSSDGQSSALPSLAFACRRTFFVTRWRCSYCGRASTW